MSGSRLPRVRLLDIASVVLLVAAVGVAALPPALDDTDERAPRMPGEIVTPSPVLPPRDSLLAAGDSARSRTIEGNVFSASRRAPRVRFRAPGTDAADASVAAAYDPFAPASAGTEIVGAEGTGGASGTAATDDVPHLYGVVVADGVRRALLALAPGEAPRLLAVGDRHAGYQVTAIENDRVTLSQAGSTRTLRLTRAASRDSSENLP